MATVHVRMISRMAGPDGTAMPGETPLLPIELAKALVTGGYAEYLGSEPTREIPVVETATLEPEEAAVKPPQRKPVAKARKKQARKKR